MIVTDQWKPFTGSLRYAPTGKDYDPRNAHSRVDPNEAYWRLAGMVDEGFGSGGATMEEIYESLLRDKGLSSSNTRELVQGALRAGYLKGVK